MSKIRAPFPWFGGKGNPKIKNAILTALPPHTRYIEPFGGGASILMAKEQVEVETYNDVNRGVHLLGGFAHCKTADCVSVKVEFGNCLHMVTS